MSSSVTSSVKRSNSFFLLVESFQGACQHRRKVNQHKRCQRFLHWSCGEGGYLFLAGQDQRPIIQPVFLRPGPTLKSAFETVWCNVPSPPSLPQFIEPCRSDRWTAADMKLYLTHYTNSAHILDTFKWVNVLLFCKAYQVEPGTHPAWLINSQRGRPMLKTHGFVESLERTNQ